MQAFFKKHIDQTLVAITLVLVVTLAGFFVWSFLQLAGQINHIISFTPAAPQGASFDIKGAASLDLKGLANTSTPAAAPATAPQGPAPQTPTSTPAPGQKTP